MKCNKYKTKSGKEIRLWQGDCMELMEGKSEDYWDLCIVDPPYKKDTNGLKAGFNRSFNYETFTPPNKKYINKLFSISENQILWGFNYYLELLPNTDSIICWFKHQNGHFSECEYAWSSVKKTRLFDRSYQKDQYNKIHPTQKPVKLYRWLLNNYTKKADTILDTHGGSMSLAIACYMEDFELDIIELDEDYYNDAIQRFEKHISQQTLF